MVLGLFEAFDLGWIYTKALPCFQQFLEKFRSEEILMGLPAFEASSQLLPNTITEPNSK